MIKSYTQQEVNECAKEAIRNFLNYIDECSNEMFYSFMGDFKEEEEN